MIKKHIFYLMLSATILVTKPLFGMSAEDHPEKKGTIHQFTEINEIESKGIFYTLPDELITEILLEFIAPTRIRPLPPKPNNMGPFSRSSKAMYTLLHSPALGTHLATRQNFPCLLDAPLPIKNLVQEAYIHADRLYYDDLFNNLQKNYVVKVSEIQGFMAQNHPLSFQDQLVTYKFLIGERSLVLSYRLEGDRIRKEGPLKRLCPYSSIVFSYSDSIYGPAFMSRYLILNDLYDEMQNSHEGEHENCLNTYNSFLVDHFVANNPFVIIDEKKMAAWYHNNDF